MNQSNLSVVDWSSMPKPEDDGKSSHLRGMKVPSIIMKGTDGRYVDISSLPGATVLFVYPMTGRPDTPLPDGWDQVPGARGCTPQSCSFRDLYTEFQALGVKNLFGMSTQSTEYQSEAVKRLRLPFPMLSDSDLNFSKALSLPSMVVEKMILLKRITFVIDEGSINKVFYPVFPPDRNAIEVINYLKQRG